MRTLLVLLTALTLAFAGCTSEPAPSEVPTTETGDEGDAGTSGDPETVEENGETSEPAEESEPNPSDAFVSLEVDLTEGDAPISVTFSLDGQQNETINYTITFGDGASQEGSTSEFPLTIVHEFAYAGTYETVLTGLYVDEFGDFHQTASVELNLGGTPAPPGSGQVIGTERYTYSGTVTAGIQHISCEVPDPLPPVNQVTHDIPIPDNYEGLPALVSKFDVQFTNGPTAIDIDVAFLDPDGNTLATSTKFEIAEGEEAFSIEGDFRDGIYTMVVNSCAALNGEYSFTIDATYRVR